MDLTTTGPLIWMLLAGAVLIAAALSLADRPRLLRWGAAALRAGGLILLVLVLCRPLWLSESEDRHVAYLLDVSQSMDLDVATAALGEIERRIDALGDDDGHSLLAFAHGVRALEPEALRETIGRWQSGANDDRFRSGSRLGHALRAARLELPAGKVPMVEVWSDGQATDDELATALAELEAAGVAVRFRRLDGLRADEVALAELRASTTRAFQGEVVRLTARVVANASNRARVRILHKGVAVDEREVELDAEAAAEVPFDVDMTTPGDSHWACEVIPERDHFLVNNSGSVTVTVRGQPRILMLHERPRELRPIKRALEEQGFTVETRSEHGLPTDLSAMLAFDALVLAQVPATELSGRQMRLVQRYVTDFGGGLIMLGSEESFGIGGYFQTPIEEVLPLTSRYEKEKEHPSIAMVLVMDKSGSMQGQPISLARQAAKATVDVLGQRDRIGVVAFDGSAFVVSELRSAVDAPAIKNAIDAIGAGGGTNMYPGLAVARDMLLAAPAKIKHVIVLGDGQSQPADFLGITREMADHAMTVSTVALGAGADQQLLAAIAHVGKGRAYVTMDPTTVPQIFTKETMEAASSAIREDLFGVVQIGDHPMLAGYHEDELPFVLGYVMTEAKPTAQVLLVAETGDPLLAIGRYGLGVGMAWTADWSERWGAEWLAWNSGGRFWAQALRSVVRRGDRQGLRVERRVEDDALILDITRRDVAGAPVPEVDWQAAAVGADGTSDALAVQVTGLGRYRVRVPLADREAVSVRLHDASHDKLAVIHHRRSYPAEYRLGAAVAAELAALPDPDAPLPSEASVAHRRPVGHWAAILALLLLTTGILLRRI